MDHNGMGGVLDSLGDRLASPGWFTIGILELFHAAAKYQPPLASEGTLLMHAVDIIPGVMTAYMGYLHLNERRAGRRERAANDATTQRMKIENERFQMENQRLVLENERINLEVKRLEIELKLKERTEDGNQCSDSERD